MIEFVDRFGGDHAGLLGVIGFVLGLLGLFYGFYSRNNPKRPKHRIQYKVFGLDDLARRVSSLRTRRRKKPESYKSYVDLWNSGLEPISGNVIRETISIGLQEGDNSILGVSVVRESHPGVSKFVAELNGQIICMHWEHFDPGMAARIEIISKLPAGSDDVSVYGSGYRLDMSRARRINNTSTLMGKISATIIFAIFPLIGFSVIMGRILTWNSHLNLSTSIWSFISAPLLVAQVVVAVACGFSAYGLHRLLVVTMTPKSSIEREDGAPQGHMQGRDYFDEEYLSIEERHIELLEREHAMKKVAPIRLARSTKKSDT